MLQHSPICCNVLLITYIRCIHSLSSNHTHKLTILRTLSEFTRGISQTTLDNCSKPTMTSMLFIYRAKKGVTKSQGSYKPADWLYFRCNSNSQLVGSALRRCVFGSWSGTAPVCIGRLGNRTLSGTRVWIRM